LYAAKSRSGLVPRIHASTSQSSVRREIEAWMAETLPATAVRGDMLICNDKY
jgi:hypothetical protein